MHLDTGFKEAHKLSTLQPKVRQKASCAELVKEIPSSKYNLFPLKYFNFITTHCKWRRILFAV